MIKIINSDLFKYDIQFVEDGKTNRYFILVNFMEDPSDIIQIDIYRKSPLSTTILYTDNIHDFQLLEKLWKSNKDLCVKTIQDLLQVNGVELCNMYTNEADYKNLKDMFDPEKPYHTIFLLVEINSAYLNNNDNLESHYNWDKIIAIAAMPVFGMVSQIQKSSKYILYNGAFLKTPSYHYNKELYNKLVYTLSEIISVFQMDEYILESIETGIMRTHTITGKKKSILEDIDIEYQRQDYLLPTTGRNEIFEKPSTNIFVISDRPSRAYHSSREVRVSMT